MADLSPAALSVWCRFCEVVEEHGPPRLGLAAALRAAADQAFPLTRTPWGSTLVPVFTAHESRDRLLAIADELENQ
jgi:hypothetical protein